MSKAFVPIVLHDNINHKYYIKAVDENGKNISTCYWSGIYPRVLIEKSIAYTELSDKLLCYDTCYINVNDYLYLVGVLGIGIVNTLISEDALKIIDDQDIRIAIFDINQDGVRSISFDSNHNHDLEVRVAEYYRIHGFQIEKTEFPKIIKNILPSAKLDNSKEMIADLNREINKDLSNLNIISNLGLINNGLITDRDNDYNQYIYNRVAYLNLFLYMINSLGLENIILPPEIQSLLDIKTGAYINSNFKKEFDAFTKICQINGVANIPKALSDKAIDFNDILRIRADKHAIRYREWLEEVCKNKQSLTDKDGQDIAQLYNVACTNNSKFEVIWNNDYAKVLKFVIPIGVGCIEPLTGVGLKAAVFSVDTILSKRFRPNMFVDEFLKKYIDKQLLIMKRDQENNYFIKHLGKISKNDLCPCGSGRKYKKCHGSD
ncbi:MAG: SEC-C domain-containing protein [Syntrophomonas sp.]